MGIILLVLLLAIILGKHILRSTFLAHCFFDI